MALDSKILPFLERGAKPGNPARWVLLPPDETITPYLKARQQRPTSDFSGTVTCTVSQRHLCSSPTSVTDAAATRPYFLPEVQGQTNKTLCLNQKLSPREEKCPLPSHLPLSATGCCWKGRLVQGRLEQLRGAPPVTYGAVCAHLSKK